MLKVKQFVFNPFGVSTFIIYDSESKAAIAIDPGMLNSAEQKEFDSYIAENNLKLTQIVNTHLQIWHKSCRTPRRCLPWQQPRRTGLAFRHQIDRQ